MSRRRRAVTPDEQRLWRLTVRDADPLPRHRPDGARGPRPTPPAAPAEAEPPAPALPPAVGTPARRPLPSPPHPLPSLDPEAAPGIDRRTDRRMMRGQFEIEGRIDLHGMTQDQAHAALSAFVLRSWREQRRQVLVITGKGSGGPGGGVLRNAVPRWLNETPLRSMVVAIRRAQPRHGGEGAIYVLLKRRRNDR